MARARAAPSVDLTTTSIGSGGLRKTSKFMRLMLKSSIDAQPARELRPVSRAVNSSRPSRVSRNGSIVGGGGLAGEFMVVESTAGECAKGCDHSVDVVRCRERPGT